MCGVYVRASAKDPARTRPVLLICPVALLPCVRVERVKVIHGLHAAVLGHGHAPLRVNSPEALSCGGSTGTHLCKPLIDGQRRATILLTHMTQPRISI